MGDTGIFGDMTFIADYYGTPQAYQQALGQTTQVFPISPGDKPMF